MNFVKQITVEWEEENGTFLSQSGESQTVFECPPELWEANEACESGLVEEEELCELVDKWIDETTGFCHVGWVINLWPTPKDIVRLS